MGPRCSAESNGNCLVLCPAGCRPIAGVICQPWAPSTSDVPGGQSLSQRVVWASIYDGPFHYVYPHAEPAVPEDGECWEKLETKVRWLTAPGWTDRSS